MVQKLHLGPLISEMIIINFCKKMYAYISSLGGRHGLKWRVREFVAKEEGAEPSVQIRLFLIVAILL
jgi:hypothetical protein